jgi:lysylphosphatidylglycerol synthetase-like protein (DUF2156 family)
MTKDIEKIENQRILYLKWHILGVTLFIILMLVRHFLRLSDLNKELVGIIVLAGLIVSVVIQAVCALLSSLLEKEIRLDPHLKASLQNELVQAISTQSWVAAYIGAAGMTVFFAIAWYFYPLCDPVTISLCSIAMGAGANRIYFYIRYKNI